jgi:hypothetical protein
VDKDKSQRAADKATLARARSDARAAEQQLQQQYTAAPCSTAGQRKRTSGGSSLNGSSSGSRSGVAAAAEARLAEVVRLYEAGKDKAAAENDALRREVAALAEELRRVEVSPLLRSHFIVRYVRFSKFLHKDAAAT